MAQELIYTSSASGLKPGSKGFCTVAATNGIAPRMVTLMESLSGYRHAVPPTQTPNPGNPVAYSHLHTPAGDSLVSRVADAGLDYSGRSNKIAHHLLLASDERGRFGPAAMMRARDNLVTQWQSEPRWLGQRQLDSGTEATIPAANWQQVTSDAGWAGVLAQAAMDPKRPDCFVIFESGQDVLALFDESLALLPPEQRWRVSFSTFFAKLPPGMSCQWRAVLQGSAEHRAVPPHNRVVRIDLTTMSRTEDSGPLIQRARTGKATTVVPVPPVPGRRFKQAKPDEPVATPVPPSPPPESADHPHLPAFQDSPPILNATSERQPSRSSSKPIILIAAMCLMVTFLALAGFLASYLTKETARPAEPTSDVSSPPLAQSDFDTNPNVIDEPKIVSDPVEPGTQSSNGEDVASDPPLDEANLNEPVAMEEAKGASSIDASPSETEAMASETEDAVAIEPSTDPQPVPETQVAPESTPIRLRYLLDPVVWRQYAKQKREWTGDQSVYRRALDLEEPDRVAVVKLAANGSITKDELFKYDTTSKALVFGELSGGGLVPPTKVMLFEAGSVILQPNYAKRIADRFVIAQTGDDWSLLTIQGAMTPRAGMDEPLRTQLALGISNKASLTIDLGPINPQLLRLASFQLSPAASKSWTATGTASGFQLARSFGRRQRMDDPPTKVIVDFTLNRQDFPSVRVSASLREPNLRFQGKSKPNDNSVFTEVAPSVRAARNQLPDHPIEVELVAEIMLGKTPYSTVLSQFEIGFK